LYDLDFQTDDLSSQNPPNNGTLNTVGPYGVTIDSVQNASFDIVTQPGDADPGIAGDEGYAVIRRPDAPIDDPGKWLLYQVDLATGEMRGGALVGIFEVNPAADFTGGLAVIIPEPSSLFVAMLGAFGFFVVCRRKRLMSVRQPPSSC
jgi:hypothetical protein